MPPGFPPLPEGVPPPEPGSIGDYISEPTHKRTECPKDMAALPIGGCIDRFEASAGKGSVGAPDGKGTTVVAVSAPGKLPLRDVSLLQAKKACENAGKRLCEEKEWRSACKTRSNWRYPDVQAYPYGRKFEPGRCNDYHASNEGKKGVARTADFGNCVTPTGIYDMSGNVAELVATQEKSGRYAARGGTWFNTVLDSSCDEDDYQLSAEEHHANVGFRCCADGKPLPDEPPAPGK